MPLNINVMWFIKLTRQYFLHQEKPKNGYTVSPVNQASCTATEILPLLQSLLFQNDIQRVCHVWPIYIQILFFIESTLLASERFTLFLFIFFAGESH